MRTRKQISVISGLLLTFALLLTPKARADEWNQATKLTFNQPLEIPGHKILAAGTYWFVTMADLSPDGDNIVRILNADQSKTMAVLSTVPVQRATPTESTQISFAKPSGNQPDVLVSWFYPDRATGHEFVYGRQEEKAVNSDPVIKVMASRAAPSYGD